MCHLPNHLMGVFEFLDYFNGLSKNELEYNHELFLEDLANVLSKSETSYQRFIYDK